MAANKVSRQLYCPNSLHFFKIILDDTIQSRKLRLPMSFVRKLGKSLCSLKVVGLEVPSGDEWKVGLQVSDNGVVWLEKGWVEFASFYNVEYGDFLVFRYEFGSSKFQVMIFNKSTTEIQYAIQPSSSSSTLTTPEPEDVVYPDKVTSNRSLKTSRGDKASSLLGSRSSTRLKMSNHEASPSNHGEEEAVVRTQTNNLYFEVVMRPSSLHRRYVWWLPQNLVQEYINDEEDEGEIKLIGISPNGKNKTWVVKYTLHAYIGRMKGSIIRRAKGSTVDWKAFVEDNKLVVGDVCVFELIGSGGNVNPSSFKITIRRATQKDQPSTLHLSTKAGLKGKEEVTNPDFYAEEHEKLLDNQIQYSDEMPYISCRRHTPIGHRTRCSKRKLLHVDKSAKRSKTVDKENKEVIELDPEEDETSEGNEGVISDKQQQPGSAFVSNHPFFQATIKHSTFADNRLYVMWWFVKDNINTALKEQTATLESGDNRSWSVMLLCRCKQNLTYIWRLREFLEENNVKVGDACTFELVDKKNRVFRVSISKIR